MFQILVTSKDAEPLLFTTDHYTTMDQVEQRFSGPPPWTLTTKEGPVTVETCVPEMVVIQQKMGNRIIDRRTFTFVGGEVVENEDSITEEEVLGKKEEEMADEVKIPEVVESEAEVVQETQALVSSAYTKFVGFREKFLRQSAEASSWEDQIIEKQAEYIKKLKRVHGELTTRHEDATALEDRIVGK